MQRLSSRLVAVTTAMASAVVASVTACGDEPTEAPFECTDEHCRHPEAASVFIRNGTGRPVKVSIFQPESLRIDQRVLDGRLELPIPPSTFGAKKETTLGLPPDEVRLDSLIDVFDGNGRASRIGGIVRIDDGPAFLVIGMSANISARADADGTMIVEADDPKRTSVLRTDRNVTECPAGTFDAPFDDVPKAMRESTAEYDVRGVTRDASGCRMLTLGESGNDTTVTFRACVPDELYPFAEGEHVRVSSSGAPLGTQGMHFTNDRGDRLSLFRVAFASRVSSDVEDVLLMANEDARCARVDPLCGHVDVPMRVSAPDAGDGGGLRPVVVLGASARPVARPMCMADSDDLSATQAIARAWVARVEHVGVDADGGTSP
jgi:hypothetical protein